MKGLLEISMGTLTVIILALVVLVILLGIYRIVTGPGGVMDFGCGICNTLVGNWMSGGALSFLNPCTNIFNCCDPSKTGGNCGFSGNSAVARSATTSTLSSPIW